MRDLPSRPTASYGARDKKMLLNRGGPKAPSVPGVRGQRGLLAPSGPTPA